MAHKRIVADMIGYAEYVKKARSDEKLVENDGSMEESYLLVKGPGGLPLLPAAVKGVRGEETAKLSEKIIRAYFLDHYRMLNQLMDLIC